MFALAAPSTDRSETEEIEAISTAHAAQGNPSPHPGVDDALADYLPSIELALRSASQFGPGCPDRLGDAIRYALLAPGKRLRPALVLMAAEACGGSPEQAMPGAVAVEMIHAYSLIHDDLPAMDDDDLRRGRPTVHIQFDEATAILAGDALQPLAFAHLCRNVPDAQRLSRAIEILAVAAGPEQLVGGQADDLASEAGRFPSRSTKPLLGDAPSIQIGNTGNQMDNTGKTFSGNQDSTAEPCATREAEPTLDSLRMPSDRAQIKFLESIHRRKTGALFTASLQLGAVLSAASDLQMRALTSYLADIGLAFQVVDDLLDFTADEARLGKRTGKDIDRGKLTYPGLMGVDSARSLALELIQSAKQHVAVFGPAALRLNQLADFVLARSH